MTREEIMDELYKMIEKNKHDLELFDSAIHRTIIQKQIDALEYALVLVARLTGWIPCEDRLPEEDGFYLASVSYKYNNTEFVEVNEFSLKTGWDEDRRYKVTAWMQLPEPYKENVND